MKRYILLIIFIVSFGAFSQAQDNINIIDIVNLKQDMVILENRITTLIAKTVEIASIPNLHLFHIFLLDCIDCDTLKRDNYIDKSFLHYVNKGHYHIGRGKSEKKYLKALTLIVDSVGNVVGSADAFGVSRGSNSSNEELAQLFFKSEIDFAFYLSVPFTMKYYIGVKKDKLYALKNSFNGLEVYYIWEEFLECCFDNWIKVFRQ
jgi:uncharacterized C2H2 Zn-finger protein